MRDAFKNFTLITVAVLICLVLAWFYMRGKALSEPLQEPVKHPFLNQPVAGEPYLIAYGGGAGERPENTFLAFDHAASLDPNIILWADVRPAGDGSLVVFRDAELASTTDGNGWIGYTDPKPLTALNAAAKFKDESGQNPYLNAGAKIPTLRELLERYPKHRFVLDFHDYREGYDAKIIEAIDAAKAGDRILVQSAEDGVLKALREKKPEWLFGTSQARAVQLKMLSSIGLEPMAPLKGDVFVTDLKINHNEMLNNTMIAELKRRRMPIFAGPADTGDAARALLSRGVVGIITNRPESVLPAIKKK